MVRSDEEQMKAHNHPLSPFGFQLNDRVVGLHVPLTIWGKRMCGTVVKVWSKSLLVNWDSGGMLRITDIEQAKEKIRKMKPGEDDFE